MMQAVIVKIRTILSPAIVRALFTTTCATLLLRIMVSPLPLIFDRIAITSIPKVVTLIPPPVDPGAAPINISSMVTIFDISLISFKGIVLKPAFACNGLKYGGIYFIEETQRTIVSGSNALI